MKNRINVINIITFIIVILIAAALRLVALDKYPSGLNADEASIGYNAYSLLLTGKDEYGTPWPLSFKSFGDFKPGLYFYFVMPFVALLGLNEWAVRVPSALFGIGTVILVYFLAIEIFKEKKVALLSSFLLVISPWHIHFSRGGWETNVATFFITSGLLLFIKGLRSGRFLFWSIVSFLASMYVYQSPRLVVPVLLLILFFLYRKSLFSIIPRFQFDFAHCRHLGQVRIIGGKRILYMIFIIICLTVPLVFQFTSGGGSERFQGLSFFSDSGPSSRVNELRGEHGNMNNLDVRFVHNKLTAYGPEFLGHYLDHFKGDFLFINGDSLIRNKVPDVGQFYIIESAFLVIGLTGLILQKQIHGKLLIAWILIAPLASSMTYQTPHALRALSMVVPLTLVMGYGFWIMGNWLKRFGDIKLIIIKNKFLSSLKIYFQATIITFIAIILSFEFVRYLESYYIHYPKRYPLSWEYGFKEMVEKLEKYESSYEKVVITDRYDQPYILVLFYKKYDPVKYQPQALLSPRDKFNFGTVRAFDKYEFHSINREEVNRRINTLFVGTPQEISENAKILDQVHFPSGEVAFVIAGT